MPPPISCHCSTALSLPCSGPYLGPRTMSLPPVHILAEARAPLIVEVNQLCKEQQPLSNDLPCVQFLLHLEVDAT